MHHQTQIFLRRYNIHRELPVIECTETTIDVLRIRCCMGADWSGRRLTRQSMGGSTTRGGNRIGGWNHRSPLIGLLMGQVSRIFGYIEETVLRSIVAGACLYAA